MGQNGGVRFGVGHSRKGGYKEIKGTHMSETMRCLENSKEEWGSE